MINRRLSVSTRSAIACGEKLWPFLQKLPGLPKIKTIAAFVSARGEIPVESLLKSVLASGRTLVLPRVVHSENRMDFHQMDRLSDLVPGSFGILEPRADMPVVQETAIQLVLIPGVAFDPRGGRVGFGKGFYDLALPRLNPEAVRVGVAYSFQVVENLPQIEKDQKMQWILTEEGLWPCRE